MDVSIIQTHLPHLTILITAAIRASMVASILLWVVV
jgi:hypothetical protein